MTLTRDGTTYTKFSRNGTEFTTGYRDGVHILEPSAPLPSFRLDRVSSTGDIYVNALFTADILDRHGQRYMWSERPAPDGPTGSHDDGSLTPTGPGANTPTLLAVRRQRYSNTTGRMILSTRSGSGDHAGNYFGSAPPSLSIFVYDEANDSVEQITLGGSGGGGSTWAWWRISTGHTSLTTAQWQVIDGISDGQQFIMTVHSGDASYSATPAEPWEDDPNEAPFVMVASEPDSGIWQLNYGDWSGLHTWTADNISNTWMALRTPVTSDMFRAIVNGTDEIPLSDFTLELHRLGMNYYKYQFSPSIGDTVRIQKQPA